MLDLSGAGFNVAQSRAEISQFSHTAVLLYHSTVRWDSIMDCFAYLAITNFPRVWNVKANFLSNYFYDFEVIDHFVLSLRSNLDQMLVRNNKKKKTMSIWCEEKF